MTMTTETRDDMLARLDLMVRADQDDTWDLSPNDRAAIREALADMRRLDWLQERLLQEARNWRRMNGNDATEDTGGYWLHYFGEGSRENVTEAGFSVESFDGCAPTLREAIDQHRAAIDAALALPDPPPTRRSMTHGR